MILWKANVKGAFAIWAAVTAEETLSRYLSVRGTESSLNLSDGKGSQPVFPNSQSAVGAFSP